MLLLRKIFVLIIAQINSSHPEPLKHYPILIPGSFNINISFLRALLLLDGKIFVTEFTQICFSHGMCFSSEEDNGKKLNETKATKQECRIRI